MALRGYDFFLIFRAKSYASSTINKVSKDLTGMGHAAEAANAMQVGNLAAMRKMGQITGLRNQLTKEGLLTQRRSLELDRAQFDNMTHRMRLAQRLTAVETQAAPLIAKQAAGKKLTAGQMGKLIVLAEKQLILERGIESSYIRQNALKQRGTIIAHDQMAAEQRINAQLRIRQAEYNMLIAQQRALLREQALAPARGMMGRGAALTHTGALAAFGGLAGTFALGGAAQAAGEFDKLATQAATQIGSVRASWESLEGFSDKLQEEIIRLGDEFPATAEEMSKAAYDIFSSMDVNFNQGIDLLELFNKVAVAGMTDVETATDGAITVLNNFDPALKNPVKTINDMFSIIRFGRIDLETFNTMMNQIAPAAKAADQELIDVGGAIAVLTRRVGPGIASAGLARLFEIFSRRDFQEGMRKSGLAITDVSGKLLPLPEILAKIKALGARPGVELQNLIQTMTAFGAGRGKGIQATVQARRALVTLLANFEDFSGPQGVQERMVRNQEQFNKQLEVMSRAVGVRWETFVNGLRTAVREIGQDAVPAFENLGKVVGPIIKAWRDMDANTRQLIISVTAFISILALFGGVFTAIIGGVVGLIGALRFLYTLVALRLPAGIAATTTQLALMRRMLMDPAMTGKMSQLASMARGLAAAGLITVGVTLALKGDGWTSRIGQLLAAAGAGAMVGGVPGAIILPVTLVVTWTFTDQKFRADLGRAMDKAAGFFGSKSMLFNKDIAAEERQRIQALLKGGKVTRDEANKMVEAWNKLNYDIDFFPMSRKNINALIANANKMGETIPGVANKIQKSTKQTVMDQIKAAKSLDEILNIVHGYTKNEVSELEKWRKDRADVIKGATEDAQRILDQAADNLMNTYNQFRDANKQAFGTLFEGPWMTDPEMDFAKQWGYIPNTQDFITDLNMQIKAFGRWRADLGKIAKRGAPAGLVKELQALGPEAADKLAILAKASPAQFNEFVSLWKTAQKDIDKATEADFQKQLDDWYKHGQNIAFKIIAGLESEDQLLKTRFRNMISQSFSADFIAEQVAAAVAEYVKEHPDPSKIKPKQKPTPPSKPEPVTATTGGGRVNPPPGGPGSGRRGGSGPTPGSAGSRAASDRESGRSRTTQSTQEVHYHLDRRPGESVDEYLIRVKHHFRNV